MRILVTGASGQLGRALVAVAESSGAEVIAWSRPDVDITNDAIVAQVAQVAADVVINAAAWTDVDGAESHVDEAFAANALAPRYLAEGCARSGALLVQVSTNEVFAGDAARTYYEYEQPGPLSVYARSKLAGENAVLSTYDNVLVARVAWLFGPGGNNFPRKITAAADRLGALRVVADEFGNPTYTIDAAVALLRLAMEGRRGIYHVVNDGAASRFDFAAAVLVAGGRGHVALTPIAAAEWQRPARSPLHAVLANQAAAALGVSLRPWQEAVAEYVATFDPAPVAPA